MIKVPKNEGLNIVPFIDIMLVLLAIVLSISTFIAHGQIKVELPKSEFATSANDDKEKFLIAIDEENSFYLDDKPISLESLEQELNKLDKKTLVELKADKDAKFESFIQIIDLLKGKEHENFQIITERQTR
ncbi:TonB system transport protein ExbD [Campylobacter sp. MIT 12-8780]|uniref:TonB system transport protein ExbD n=1 Tax=unclassified Campylobacter TaxID=2593542 RepID=UPI00115E282D|nr:MULTISPECIES: TonB system transport protein ExbD [unclassified Campylobacter]NDJ27048.1 TonB system transport protein ExbD [Campylobacter sp. MIT 19-121]TQR41651.1 TonB system transport protein ExbD [Campylobacter sp. MIT 12-8780]